MKLINPDFTQIDTLIFDFGNVLLDINIDLSIEAFKRLHINELNTREIHPHNAGIFLEMEVGAATEAQFCDALRQKADSAQPQPTNQQILAAWNELLLPYDYDRFKMLIELRKTYKIYLLSNTNAPHHISFERRFNQENPMGLNFKQLFDGIFYSDELLCRKPDLEIYDKVQQITHLTPHKTLFIDDNEPNLVVPQKLGWRVHHLKKGEKVIGLFK